MNDYNQIFHEDFGFLENMNQSYNLYDSIDLMVQDFSGIFIVSNKDNLNDLTFRLMATYIKKKEEKTKKKQLYSLGVKEIRKIGSDSAIQIRNDFERLVLIFTQLKHYKSIDDVEIQKEEL